MCATLCIKVIEDFAMCKEIEVHQDETFHLGSSNRREKTIASLTILMEEPEH